VGRRRSTSGSFPEPLVIVCDFDLVGIALLPKETYSVLLIDSNAVLTFPIPPQTLQAIPGWDLQLQKVFYTVQLIQLPPNHRPKGLWASTPRPAGIHTEEKILSGLVRERVYHGIYYNTSRNFLLHPGRWSLLSTAVRFQITSQKLLNRP
jgi:hypothetical protein